MKRPDPAETWDLVAKHAGGKPIPACQLFDPPSRASVAETDMAAPTWADIELPKP